MSWILLLACVVEKGDSLVEDSARSEATPRTITLLIPEVGGVSEGLELATGEQVDGSGDLRLNQGYVLSLSSPLEDGICGKGEYASLGEIPVDTENCLPDGGWSTIFYLGGAMIHTEAESTVTGQGMLVWDATRMYRLRMLSDSYSPETGTTATFEYVVVQ